MSDESKRKPAAEVPKRGDAAWREAKAEIAARNEKASKAGRERRQRKYDEQAAELRAAELRERVALSKRWP